MLLFPRLSRQTWSFCSSLSAKEVKCVSVRLLVSVITQKLLNGLTGWKDMDQERNHYIDVRILMRGCVLQHGH